MSMLIKLRRTQFTAVATETAPLPPDNITQHRVFAEVPDDRLHNNNRYYDHVLRGLRHTPPGYVLDVLNGTEPPAELADQVAGVGVIQL
jgi:hypothetical protein